jgi:hypothetical protein
MQAGDPTFRRPLIPEEEVETAVCKCLQIQDTNLYLMEILSSKPSNDKCIQMLKDYVPK